MRFLVPVSALCLAASLAAVTHPARAQEKKIVLRVADSFPASGHYFSEPGAKFFMEQVRKATNGAVEFQHYPSEQLGKARDLLSLTISGVTDIGSVMPSYAPDKMPLSAVAELPGAFATSCQGTLAYWSLAREGVLSQREYRPNGARILIALTAAPYQTLMRQKISAVKDLEGKKIRTLGSAVDLAMRSLGAAPIRMAAPEINESMARGTLDGTVVSYGAALSYDLGRLSKSVTVGDGFGSAVLTYTISEARWKTLPPGVQKAMVDAGERATRNACGLMDKNTDSDLAKLQQQGVEVVRFSAGEREHLRSLFTKVSQTWAQDLDRRGRPGTEVLKAYQAAVKKYEKAQE